MEAFTQQVRNELHDFVGVASQDIKATEVIYESSSYASGIANYATDANADLIIIGSKGRTNLRYVLLGSTAESLLTKLPCSILVVKLESR
jgi:nucleotide-binding universal stress UspA family protein